MSADDLTYVLRGRGREVVCASCTTSTRDTPAGTRLPFGKRLGHPFRRVIHVMETDESRMAVKGCGSPDMDDERNQR